MERLTARELVDVAISIAQHRVDDAEHSKEHYMEQIRCMSKSIDLISRNASCIQSYAERVNEYETKRAEAHTFLGILESIRDEMDKEGEETC